MSTPAPAPEPEIDVDTLKSEYTALYRKYLLGEGVYDYLTAKRTEVLKDMDEISDKMVEIAGPLLNAGVAITLPVRRF